MSKIKKPISRWTIIGLVGALLAAPNPMIVRSVVSDMPSLWWVFLRFVIITLILLLPMLVELYKKRRTSSPQLHSAKAFRSLLIASSTLPLALVVFCEAIAQSQASYVSIVTLVSPVVLVVLSQKLLGEKVSRRATTGLGVAFGGALLLVLAPLLIQHGSVDFYPVATIYALLNVVLFSVGMIYMRKANEAGYSMMTILGISSLSGAILTGAMISISGASIVTVLGLATQPAMILPLFYSGVVVSLLARALSVVSFEHIGAAMTAGIDYFGRFLAIILPVFVLNETLSIPMVLGGSLIVFGVLIVENTLPRHHHKHHRAAVLHLKHEL